MGQAQGKGENMNGSETTWHRSIVRRKGSLFIAGGAVVGATCIWAGSLAGHTDASWISGTAASGTFVTPEVLPVENLACSSESMTLLDDETRDAFLINGEPVPEELTVYQGVDYELGWNEPDDGLTSLHVLEIDGTEVGRFDGNPSSMSFSHSGNVETSFDATFQPSVIEITRSLPDGSWEVDESLTLAYATVEFEEQFYAVLVCDAAQLVGATLSVEEEEEEEPAEEESEGQLSDSDDSAGEDTTESVDPHQEQEGSEEGTEEPSEESPSPSPYPTESPSPDETESPTPTETPSPGETVSPTPTESPNSDESPSPTPEEPASPSEDVSSEEASTTPAGDDDEDSEEAASTED